DPSRPKATDDVKREALVWRRVGVAVAGFTLDTMLASYLLDAQRHSHGIAEVARANLGLDLESYDRVTDKQRGSQQSLFEVDEGRAARYAALRAFAVGQLQEPLSKRLHDEGMTDLMQGLELP